MLQLSLTHVRAIDHAIPQVRKYLFYIYFQAEISSTQKLCIVFIASC